MSKIRISEKESVHLLEAANGRVSSFGFGPSGVWIESDDKDMMWALKEVHKLRFPEKYLEQGAGV